MTIDQITKLIQARVCVDQDGLWGPRTAKAVAKALGVSLDAPKPPSASPRKKIAIDIGHSNGRTQPNGVDEHALMVPIAGFLANDLAALGYETTVLDWPELSNSADLNNAAAALRSGQYALAVSLHANWADSSKAKGAEVLYSPDSAASKRLAQAIADRLCPAFPGRASYLQPRSDLAILNAGKASGTPTALVECGFMSNGSDLTAMVDHPSKFAALIAEGVHACAPSL